MNKIKGLMISLSLFTTICAMAGDKNRAFETAINGTKSGSCILLSKAPEFSFHLPQMAGNFRLGVANGQNSLWGSELKKVTMKESKGTFTYTLSDPLLGNGNLTIRVVGLSDTDGIVLEVEGMDLAEGLQLMWSFGGCYGKVLNDRKDSKLEPPYCKYNVFSVEGTAFSVYYGESMRLRIIHGVTPLQSDIRLSDAHKQQSPLAFFESGKETEAPALAAATPITNGKKLYFCFYTQNQKADYNYYMLPELFQRSVSTGSHSK